MSSVRGGLVREDPARPKGSTPSKTDECLEESFDFKHREEFKEGYFSYTILKALKNRKSNIVYNFCFQNVEIYHEKLVPEKTPYLSHLFLWAESISAIYKS